MITRPEQIILIFYLAYYSILQFSNLLPIILIESSIILYSVATHYSQVWLTKYQCNKINHNWSKLTAIIAPADIDSCVLSKLLKIKLSLWLVTLNSSSEVINLYHHTINFYQQRVTRDCMWVPTETARKGQEGNAVVMSFCLLFFFSLKFLPIILA